ncbi:MAG TPA: low molecular weight protein arginine phosphatase [Gemmatimonadales bacterium]|jgi:protein-tyrosine phosphatase
MNILLVCSGNTCRSPLAAAILADKLGRSPDLADTVTQSAGTAAWDGRPASEGSYLVALERGLDLSSHRARMLTADQVRWADLILTMTEAHARRVAELGGEQKVFTLGDYAGGPDGRRDVHDPMGGDVAGYREVAIVLDELLDLAIERIRVERRR